MTPHQCEVDKRHDWYQGDWPYRNTRADDCTFADLESRKRQLDSLRTVAIDGAMHILDPGDEVVKFSGRDVIPREGERIIKKNGRQWLPRPRDFRKKTHEDQIRLLEEAAERHTAWLEGDALWEKEHRNFKRNFGPGEE